MSPWIIYAVVAFAISLTSYLNIYKPALGLYKEITEEEKPFIGSAFYKLVWLSFGTVVAPFLVLPLMKGDNDKYIKDLVIAWIDEDE